MTSTFLSYRIYSNDLTKSLQRVAAEPQNATDQKYFEANIGKVKSVDDFLGNYRLFTYAMKAYGLQDLGNAKALMRQVLTSDLSDTNSVANRLNDSRYKAFAKAFNFTTTGAVASSGQLQTIEQQQDLLDRMGLLYSETSSYAAKLGKVTSVSSLESDDGLYTRVLHAFGIDEKQVTKAQVTAALESDLSDPNSFANRADITTTTKNSDGTTTTTALTSYGKLRAMAADFNFAADGSIGGQKQLQSGPSIAATQTAYMSKIPSDAASQATAATDSAYYAKKLPTLSSVDQLLSDSRLVAVVKTAFGLDANMSNTQLRNVLSSNLLDPKSLANTFNVDPKTPPTSPTAYQLAAAAFNVGTDGTAWDHGMVLSSANLTSITTAYTTATTTAANAATGATTASIAAATKAAQTETDYFNSTIGTVTSVSGLLADSRLVSYLQTAFNLPAQTTTTVGTTTTTTGFSLTDLGNILKGNVLDSTSAADTNGASARKLATSFNFASNGLVYSQRPIQNATNITATTTAYNAVAGTSASAKAAAQTETDYYTSTMPYVKSVDDLLANKRLVAYLTQAYNLPTTQPSVLRQVMTSNLLDPKSKANTLGGGYQTLAAAFDISSDGSITHTPDRQVQTKTGIAATHTAYLDQMMENEASDQDGDGVRLALYFKRVAPTITSAYGILADKALTKVVQTMLGLSSNSSNADIDSQARFISSKIKIADFKDPAKLDKLVARFAALYDLTNTSTDSSGSSSGNLSVTSLFS